MAEPTHISGNVGTGDVTAARRVLDVQDKIFLLEPRKNPFVTFLTTVGKTAPDGSNYKGAGILKSQTINPKFTWFEDAYGGRWTQVDNSGGYNSAAVSIVVDNGDLFTVGDIVKIPRTGEVLYVSAVNTGTETLTVTRSVGGTAAATINDNDYLYIIGNANDENASSRTANTTQTSEKYNYTQIFRTTMDASNTLEESELYGSGKGDLAYRRGKKGHEHCVDIERSFFFSERSTASGSAGTRRTTGGVLEYISTNVTDQSSSTLTETEFITFLSTGFKYGSSEKILFCDNRIMQAISGYALSNVRVKPKEDTYGVAVTQYHSPFGMVNLVHHTEFINSYAGYAFMVDLETMKYRYMRNRDTKLNMNIQNNDVDGQKDEYLTECGLQRSNEERNAVLYGVTTS